MPGGYILKKFLNHSEVAYFSDGFAFLENKPFIYLKMHLPF